MSELFVICFKETKELVSGDNYKKYWPNYGNSGLHGWRPPKKVYFSLGQAKRGFAAIPEELKPLCEISTFVWSASVLDGAELGKKQKIARDARKKQDEIARLKYKVECKIKLLTNSTKDKKELDEMIQQLQQLRGLKLPDDGD